MTETDKLGHGLLAEYRRILPKDKNATFKIFEVGVYHGGFLEWLVKEYPNAKVYGIDVYMVDVPGTVTASINQNDRVGLRNFTLEHGPFDYVVDDASHMEKETQTTWEVLWGFVAPNGLYVIEDWAAGIWAKEAPGMYGQYAGIERVVADKLERAHALGISGVEVIYRQPRCSLAMFRKKL